MNAKELVGLYLDVEVASNNYMNAITKFRHFINSAVFYDDPDESHEKRESILKDMRKIVEESEFENLEGIISDLRNYLSRSKGYEPEQWLAERVIYDLEEIEREKRESKNDG